MLHVNKTETNSLEGNSINEKVFDLLEKTNTNWSVSQHPLITKGGIKTESVGIFKNNVMGEPEHWLGTKSDKYVPLQNADLAQTIVEASSGIGEVFRGGYIQEGKKVFYQIALPDYKIANDTVKRWITAINSHDGSTSIGFGSSNTVVICQNTFYKAYKEVEKFKHFANAKQRLEFAKKQLQLTLNNDNNLMTDFERMTEHKIERPIFESVIKKLFGVDSLEVKGEEVSTRKRNQMNKFNEVLAGELTSHGDSLWGLFNAVTYYENHITSKEDNKTERILIGNAGRSMNITFNEIMDWIDNNTAKKSIHLV